MRSYAELWHHSMLASISAPDVARSVHGMSRCTQQTLFLRRKRTTSCSQCFSSPAPGSAVITFGLIQNGWGYRTGSLFLTISFHAKLLRAFDLCRIAARASSGDMGSFLCRNFAGKGRQGRPQVRDRYRCATGHRVARRLGHASVSNATKNGAKTLYRHLKHFRPARSARWPPGPPSSRVTSISYSIRELGLGVTVSSCMTRRLVAKEKEMPTAKKGHTRICVWRCTLPAFSTGVSQA